MDPTLERLICCHSTPGDEDDVARVLLEHWREQGWQTRAHGRYAVSARRASENGVERPMLLVCAHMDSPGFSVQTVQNNTLGLTPLGGVRFEDESTQAVLKVGEDRLQVQVLRGDIDAGEPEYFIEGMAQGTYGDRVCYGARPIVEHGILRSPFLDNRLGCFALIQLSCLLAEEGGAAFDIVLGATACEEIGGFGAQVLAAQIRPDMVVCIDATYEDEGQNVVLGGGPVLTLSDASVLLGCAMRDRVADFFARSGIPLQTEVYNFSGTDSRAFPQQGLSAPVLSLLVPTRGNHTPTEVGAIRDFDNLVRALHRICCTPVAEAPFPGAFE